MFWKMQDSILIDEFPADCTIPPSTLEVQLEKRESIIVRLDPRISNIEFILSPPLHKKLIDLTVTAKHPVLKKQEIYPGFVCKTYPEGFP
jgi:hypothetical protein